MCGGQCAPPCPLVLSVNSFYRTMRPRHPGYEESARSPYGDGPRACPRAETTVALFFAVRPYAPPPSRIQTLPQAVDQTPVSAGEPKKLLFAVGCDGRVPMGSGALPEHVLPLHLIEPNQPAGVGVVHRTIYVTPVAGGRHRFVVRF